MATYDVNGQRLAAREEGPANAPVALLIHGWSSSWFALSPLLPLLSKRFACIAVDLPGYGRSPRSDEPPTITGYADLLAALINEVSDQPVVLVGHSMGGMISLTLALRHPHLVERMVLICPTISGRLSHFVNFVIQPILLIEHTVIGERLLGLVERHSTALTDRLMRPASFAERTGIAWRDYVRLRADARRPGHGRVRAECYRAMHRGDLRGKLGQIAAPALVLWGAEDNTVPLRDASVVADEWPDADLRIIAGAGHWPQFERPEVTRRYIASFLGLPLPSSRPDDTLSAAAQVNQAAVFLGRSELGSGLSLAQRARIAAQCRNTTYAPGEVVASADQPGDELFLVWDGILEVWSTARHGVDLLDGAGRLADLVPGQIAGELSVLNGERRSASLYAGPLGCTLLRLSRDRLVALCDDDPELGRRLLWNMATTLAMRLRLARWQQLAPPQELVRIVGSQPPTTEAPNVQ